MTNRIACRRNRKRGAFTLMEVLLVLVILVVLGSMAVLAFGPMQRKAYIRAAKGQIGALKAPLNAYRLDMGDYPPDLQCLRVPPAGGEGAWGGPYLETDIPLDPWRNPYQYQVDVELGDAVPRIWSMGPDGVNGNEDDVCSWRD